MPTGSGPGQGVQWTPPLDWKPPDRARPLTVLIGIGVLLVVLTVGGLVLSSVVPAEPPDPTTTSYPPQSGPFTGDLTVVAGHSYVLRGGAPAEVGQPGGASVGTLQGTDTGVAVDGFALPLAASAASAYASCQRLPWTAQGEYKLEYGPGRPITAGALVAGARFCVQSTWSGLWMSELTVLTRSRTTTTFATRTWGCSARDDESTLC